MKIGILGCGQAGSRIALALSSITSEATLIVGEPVQVSCVFDPASRFFVEFGARHDDDPAPDLSRGGRGPLLDMPKLNNISSEMFACINNVKLDNMVRGWALYYDRVFFTALAEQLDYNPKVFGIERLCFDNYTKLDVRPNKIRKDIVKLSDIKQQYYYFWDDLYQEEKSNRQLDNNYPFSSSISIELKEKITNLYVSGTIVSMDIWLAQMKEFSTYFGYDKFANFMHDLRLAITLEEKTPNLYDVMAVMGVERVVSRL